MINNYRDFLDVLQKAGFSMGGGNDEGIFSFITWNWNEPPPYDTPIDWHTGDPETDPWEWRIRVLDENRGIAYAKLFFKKSGFITKEWYPYFLAARRGGKTFDDAYEDGTISHFGKRIYDVVSAKDTVPVHDIKQIAGFTREDKPSFDRALTELQMGLFITMSGNSQRISLKGEEYNTWPSTVFCTTERFFGGELFEVAAKIDPDEAVSKIRKQILKLNPSAQEKKILKFILGR